MTSIQSWQRRLARIRQERDVLADQLAALRREAVQDAVREALSGQDQTMVDLLVSITKTAVFIDKAGEIDYGAITEYIQPFKETHHV